MIRTAALLAALTVGTAGAGTTPLGDAIYVVPGGAQGGRGDLLEMPAATIGGVHVIQGGSVECTNAGELPPCTNSGQRRASWNLDIGSGDGTTHRGDLGLNYDVGNCIKLFDGRTHAGITVCPSSNHRHAVVTITGDLVVRGRIRTTSAGRRRPSPAPSGRAAR